MVLDYTYGLYDDLSRFAVESGTGILTNNSNVLLVPELVLGTTIRIGSVLSILALPLHVPGFNTTELRGGTVFYYLTALLAVMQAVVDFNRRSSPYGNIEEATRGCNFFLTAAMHPGTAMEPTLAALIWQDEILLKERTITQSPLEPFAIIGPTSSNEAAVVGTLGGVYPQAVSPDTGKFEVLGVPNISPSATSSGLADRGKYPFLAASIPSDRYDAEALCAYLHSIGVEHLGVLFTTDIFGPSYGEAFRDVCPALGVRIHTFTYNAGLKASLWWTIRRMKVSGLRYFFAAVSRRNWEDSLLELVRGDFLGNPDYVWFFSNSIRSLVSGFVGSGLVENEEVALALNRTAVASFRGPRDSYERKNRTGIETDEEVQRYWRYVTTRASFLDGNNMTVEEADAVVSLLVLLSSPTTYSLFTYDAVISLGIAACQAENQQFTGRELFEALKHVNFTGATGRVRYNATTGLRQGRGMVFAIENIMVHDDHMNGTYLTSVSEALDVMLGEHAGEYEVIAHNPLVFPSGSTEPPPQLREKEVNMNLAPLSVLVLCWILSATVILSSIGLATWTMVMQNTPEVRAAQPVFLVLLCFATFLVGLSTVTSTMQEPVPHEVLHRTCMATKWLHYLGITLTLTTLFTKTWRINQVYRSAKKFRRVVIRAKDVLWPLALLMTLNVIILSTWTALDPAEWSRIVLVEDKFGRPTSSYGTCLGAVNTPFSNPYADALLVVNSIALIMVFYQCYKARNLPSQFNETHHIWVAFLILLEAFLIGGPVLFLVSQDTDASGYMLTRTIVYSIFSMGILFPIFMPKFRSHRNQGRQAAEQQETKKSHPVRFGVTNKSSDGVMTSPYAHHCFDYGTTRVTRVQQGGVNAQH